MKRHLHKLIAVIAVFAASMMSVPAFAHGLLMKLDADGETISGEVFFSNGQKAGGVWVELFDETAPDAAIETIQTADDGSFSVAGKAGTAYRVRASGDEGHEIVMTIALEGETARGVMVDDATEEEQSQEREVPAWAVLGGFLLLSLIPVYWLRRRSEPVED